MKQNLPNIIKENKDLQQALLKQDGFMKFVAGHIDDCKDGLSLYAQYQEQIFATYRRDNSWNPDVQLMSGDEFQQEALGPSNHLMIEFHCRKVVERLLTGLIEDEADTIRGYYDGYMAYAWRDYFERGNPEHATDAGLYKVLMEQFLKPNGLALRCMDIVLKEHHGKGLTEKDQYDYYRIAEYHYFYFDESGHLGRRAFDRLRRGVEEWLDGKDDEECRELAVDMLEKVRFFSQHLYNDEARFSSYIVSFTQEDKRWLRQMARGLGNKPTEACFYFSEFVYLLQEVGRIWAARLLKKHHIDLHVLEKETNSFMQPYDAGEDGYNYFFYVDHYYNTDSPNTCCIKNVRKAKELLYALHGKKEGEETTDQIEVEEQNCLTKNVPSGRIIRERSCKHNPPRVVPSFPKTLAYFSTDPEIKEKQQKRVTAIFQLWTHWGWIDSETTANDFDYFFMGNDRHCNIKWIVNNAILTYLLHRLINWEYIKNKKQKGLHVNSLIKQQFGRKRDDSYRKRVDAVNINRIDFTIFILDLNNCFQDTYDEAEKLNLSDNELKLLKEYVDKEVQEAAQQEAKAGNLRVGNGIWR